MAVRTSTPPSVPGPRTPFALYPELLDPNPGHEGYKWRAGFRRKADGRSRYTSEYQRQYRPLTVTEAVPPPAEAEREEVGEDRLSRPMAIETREAGPIHPDPLRGEVRPVSPLVAEREEVGDRLSHPVVDLRRVYREVEGNIPSRVAVAGKRDVHSSPSKTIEDRLKRCATRNGKKGAKRAKKEQLLPPPLSEYQAQFQAWLSHSQEKATTVNTVSCAPKKTLSADIRPTTPPARDPRPSRYLQRSPRRWSSEYQANFSSPPPTPSDPTEEIATRPWYQMLVELRERARVYRDRGRSSNLELPLSCRSSQVSDTSRLPSARTEPPLLGPDPPLLHAEPPLLNSDTPLLNSDTPLLNSGPPLLNSGPPLLNSGPPLLQTDILPQEKHSLNCTRDTATQMTSRSVTQSAPPAPIPRLENSLSKLQIAAPAPMRPTPFQLDRLETPTSQLQRALSNSLRASVENHKSLSPVPLEALRARTAVPPIDIDRIQTSPSPPRTPSYSPPPLPHTALSPAESLQSQLFQYKQPGLRMDADQISVASTTSSLASHTLEKARRRQEFWK